MRRDAKVYADQPVRPQIKLAAARAREQDLHQLALGSARVGLFAAEPRVREEDDLQYGMEDRKTPFQIAFNCSQMVLDTYSTFRNRRTPQGRVPGTQKKIKMTRFVPGTRKTKVAYPPSWGVRFSRPPRACENFAYRVRDFFFVRGGYAKKYFSRTPKMMVKS